MDEPLVSAIFPVRNCRAYIQESIQSIMSQDYKRIEIIVVDDGSSDGTGDLISRLKNSNLKLYTLPPQGVSAAFNFAIEKSFGDIILVCSGDDISAADRAGRQVSVLKSTSIDITACWPTVVGESKDHGIEHIQNVQDWFCREDIGSIDDIFASLFYQGNSICAPTVAMKRKVWDVVGEADPALLQTQDYNYWLRAAIHGFKINIERHSHLFYRLHDSNLSAASRDARTNREIAYIFRALMSEMPQPIAKALISHHLKRNPILAENYSCQIDALAIPLSYIFHNNDFIRQIGYDRLLRMMTDRRISSEFGGLCDKILNTV